MLLCITDTLAFWEKANGSPVCFGTRNTQYGTFYTPLSGKVASVKLVHLYGYVSCHKHNADNWSFWGCGHGVKDLVNVAITTSDNHMILPPNQFIGNRAGKWSKLPGYNSFNPVIELSVFSHPYELSEKTELHLWYAEDLVNYTESDNGGRVCADVYLLYVWEVLTRRPIPLLFTL